MSAAKQKGTAGETELVRLVVGEFEPYPPTVRRTPPGSNYDVVVTWRNTEGLAPLELLATRPDRGEWLVTLRFNEFLKLVPRVPLHIEVKRYRKFSLHTIFRAKFGKAAL